MDESKWSIVVVREWIKNVSNPLLYMNHLVTAIDFDPSVSSSLPDRVRFFECGSENGTGYNHFFGRDPYRANRYVFSRTTKQGDKSTKRRFHPGVESCRMNRFFQETFSPQVVDAVLQRSSINFSAGIFDTDVDFLSYLVSFDHINIMPSHETSGSSRFLFN